MATPSSEELVAGARTILRDYPQYFEADEGPLNVLTIRLPHPNVSSATLQVYLTPPPPDETTPPVTSISSAWQLEERNGLLKLTEESALNNRVLVSGFYTTWFTDGDLAFHLGKSSHDLDYTNGGTLDGFTTMHYDVLILGGVINALWSLAMELSLDIDVSTPEGMFIPARQRFTQVIQMLQNYEQEYTNKAAMLNIGLGALEVFRLRRVAYTTGRYVPVYREREFDDPTAPERLYPPIPYGIPPSDEEQVLTEGVEVSEW